MKKYDPEKFVVVGKRRPLHKLLDRKSSGTENLVFTGDSFFFVPPDSKSKKPIRFNGITRVLEEHIWPLPGTPVPPKRKLSSGSKQKGWKRRKHSNGSTIKKSAVTRLTGFARGSLIHAQIHDFVTMGLDGFRTRNPEVHPWIDSLVTLLLERDWAPAAAEFGTFHEQLRIATKIDLICVTRQGILIFIEIKTGYQNGAFFREEGSFQPPFGGIQSTPRLKAAFQMILGLTMVLQLHKIRLKDTESYIVRLSDEPIECEKIDNEFIYSHSDKMYERLKQCRS